MVQAYAKSSAAKLGLMVLALFGVGISQAQAETACHVGWKVVGIGTTIWLDYRVFIEVQSPDGKQKVRYYSMETLPESVEARLFRLATTAYMTNDPVDVLATSCGSNGSHINGWTDIHVHQ